MGSDDSNSESGRAVYPEIIVNHERLPSLQSYILYTRDEGDTVKTRLAFWRVLRVKERDVALGRIETLDVRSRVEGYPN